MGELYGMQIMSGNCYLMGGLGQDCSFSQPGGMLIVSISHNSLSTDHVQELFLNKIQIF